MVLRLVLLCAVLLSGIVLLVSGVDLRSLVMEALATIRTAGPVWFFLAMALLPAVGAPMSFFCLAAGSVFAPHLGMPLVLALALAAIAANIALSWLLASRILHPPLQALLQRLGYRIPQARIDTVNDLIVIVRVTPGIPFAVQNYLLGLASVPFGRYMLISTLIAFPLNAAIIYFGDSLVQGAGGKALVGLLLVVALVAAVHMLRRHYGGRARSGAG